MDSGEGLPSSIDVAVRNALCQSIASLIRGDDPVLKWAPPIYGARALKLTLEDRQQRPGSYNRLSLVTLRSKETHCERAGRDNVRVAVEYDAGTRLHFGRCTHFMRDSRGAHFVALRWYTETARGFAEHEDTGAIRLRIAPAGQPSSYSVMPVNCIVNGAYIIDWGGYSWVIQSPREDAFYARTNRQ